MARTIGAGQVESREGMSRDKTRPKRGKAYWLSFFHPFHLFASDRSWRIGWRGRLHHMLLSHFFVSLSFMLPCGVFFSDLGRWKGEKGKGGGLRSGNESMICLLYFSSSFCTSFFSFQVECFFREIFFSPLE
ncbi:hypothetical protein F4775DRAFT_306431 [Biscogniauxia sp. FL1348]|nr:hypothetical protein F4775DRAFT_306431 [Biscogniauxia sp. FL1348]